MSEETYAVGVDPIQPALIVTEEMKATLRSSVRWAKFLLVVMTIMLVLLLCLGVVLIIFANKSTLLILPYASSELFVQGIIDVVLVLLLIYPLVKGYIFCKSIRRACDTDSETELARGLSAMRLWLRFYGILTIIALVLYPLLAIGFIIARSD